MYKEQKKKIYVVAGGTFDHFHKGHELFLKTAFETGDYLAIGITSDKMIAEKPLSYSIEPFNIRKQYVEQYFKSINGNVKVQIMKLDEPFGISVSDSHIDKIIVTKETKPNAIIINKIRRKNHLKALKIVVVPYVKADDNRKISSFRIRKGEISRHGHCYKKLLFSKQKFYLPDALRVSLREPLGRVFSTKKEIDVYIKSLQGNKKTFKRNEMIITVGDIVSLSLLNKKIAPSLMIYDYITRREALSEKQQLYLCSNTKTTIYNQAGTIRRSAIKSIYKAMNTVSKTKEKYGIKVIGEEDLLVLPTILMAPLGSLVCYGQKDLGFIAVTITEKTKEKVKELLQMFT